MMATRISSAARGPRLARLYGVNIRDCVFGDVPGYREQEGDIHLRPRFDGDYSLPQGKDSNEPSTP